MYTHIVRDRELLKGSLCTFIDIKNKKSSLKTVYQNEDLKDTAKILQSQFLDWL